MVEFSRNEMTLAYRAKEKEGGRRRKELKRENPFSTLNIIYASKTLLIIIFFLL